MKIETKNCGHQTSIHVNGIKVGETYSYKGVKYGDEIRRAKEQVKKRTKVIDRNIERLYKEIELLKKEKDFINAS